MIVPKEIYERWRRFLPYSIWSSRIVLDCWNPAVRLKSSIRRAKPEEARRREDEFRFFIESTRTFTDLMCDAIRRADWRYTYVDVEFVRLAESRAFIPWVVEEGVPFNVLCEWINSLLDDCLKELEEKLLSVIFGTVVDAETKTPLVGARVEADGYVGIVLDMIAGRYRIENLPAGIYEVTASFEEQGYAEETVTVELPPNAEVNFELSKKRKLVALHKRWFYESPRGRGHNISIEGIATIIIPWKEKKEDYEADLEKALKAKLLEQEGFERLEEPLTQEVLGFEEVETDEEERDIKVEEIKWDHKIVTRQLSISDYLR